MMTTTMTIMIVFRTMVESRWDQRQQCYVCDAPSIRSAAIFSPVLPPPVDQRSALVGQSLWTEAFPMDQCQKNIAPSLLNGWRNLIDRVVNTWSPLVCSFRAWSGAYVILRAIRLAFSLLLPRFNLFFSTWLRALTRWLLIYVCSCYSLSTHPLLSFFSPSFARLIHLYCFYSHWYLSLSIFISSFSSLGNIRVFLLLYFYFFSRFLWFLWRFFLLTTIVQSSLCWFFNFSLLTSQ